MLNCNDFADLTICGRFNARAIFQCTTALDRRVAHRLQRIKAIRQFLGCTLTRRQLREWRNRDLPTELLTGKATASELSTLSEHQAVARPCATIRSGLRAAAPLLRAGARQVTLTHRDYLISAVSWSYAQQKCNEIVCAQGARNNYRILAHDCAASALQRATVLREP